MDKKIYLILSIDWGCTGISFDNEIEAQEFIEMKNNARNDNDYYIQPCKIFHSIHEANMANKPKTVQELKETLQFLVNEKKYFVTVKYGTISVYYRDLKRISNNKVDISSSFDEDQEAYIDVVSSDYNAFVKEYKKANAKIEYYKAMLNKYTSPIEDEFIM